MPTSPGDVVDLDLGAPEGREAGLRRPAVVVTAGRVLERSPSVIHVVPLTRTVRGYESEVTIQPGEATGIDEVSVAQCQHLRAVSPQRVAAIRGNVGPVVLAQIRETIAVLLDVPG